MNDFVRDNEWQREQRDNILVPGFYQRYAFDGRYVLIDKGRFANILQRRFEVDTIMQAGEGNAIALEEKIVRWPGYTYTAYTLETESCTNPGHESEGWMRYGQADYLLYCFQNEHDGLDCHLVDFPKLKAWFWERVETFPTFLMQTKNRSAGRKVPISAVQKAIGVKTYSLPL